MPTLGKRHETANFSGRERVALFGAKISSPGTRARWPLNYETSSQWHVVGLSVGCLT
jgi:hypothetical protein